ATGLVVSQQLAGCWPKFKEHKWLLTITAILNSPLASAYIGIFDSRKRFRLQVLEDLPIPYHLDPDSLIPLIEKVHRLASPRSILTATQDDALTSALLTLDAAILAAYALPPRLERQLLAYFQSAKRPIVGEFAGYPEDDGGMARSLDEILAKRFEDTRGTGLAKSLGRSPLLRAN